MNYTFRPLRWTDPSTPAAERRSRWTFRADWSDTLKLLEREIEHLEARDIVIEADFTEGDIRLDGMPRANARQPVHPGVRIAFNSKHGPLVYSTDSCERWQHNVRSIALGLECLRAVDRYDISKRGEQYTGWKTIAAAAHLSEAGAWAIIHRLAGVPTTDADASRAPVSSTDRDRFIRMAMRNAHPDRGGTSQTWDDFNRARRVVVAGGSDT